MELRFKDDGHLYESINEPKYKWVSATTLVKLFYEQFDQKAVAAKVSKKPRSKWYGLSPKKIIEIWNNEANRASRAGSWYHDQREKETSMCETLRRNGMDLPIIKPITDGEYRISPSQQLVPGIYPEHFVYLKSAGICGQADRVEVINDVVDVYDYKTDKKMETEPYTNWEGITKMMYSPLEHLGDCALTHHNLQLSIYMYIILKHNHNLKPGKLVIQHTLFELESEDEYGFPIYKQDSEGNYIVKEVVPYELPYLKSEVQAMIKYLKLNPQTT